MANYHFMDCCFDYKKSRIIEECNLISCKGKHYFQEYFHEDHIKKSTCCYGLDRKQLEEYWQCAQIEKETSCPEHCDNCSICFDFFKIFQELQEAYFFYPRKDMNYQQIPWRIFLNNLNILLILEVKLPKQLRVINCVFKDGSMGYTFLPCRNGKPSLFKSRNQIKL